MRKTVKNLLMLSMLMTLFVACNPEEPNGEEVIVLDDLVTEVATELSSFSVTLNATVNNFDPMAVSRSNYGFLYVLSNDIDSLEALSLFEEYQDNGYAEGCKFVNGGNIEVGNKYSHTLQNLTPSQQLYYCAILTSPATKKLIIGGVQSVKINDFTPSFKVVKSTDIGYLNSTIQIEADYCGATNKNVQLGIYYHTSEDLIAVNGENVKFSEELDSVVTMKVDFLRANTTYYVKPYIYNKKSKEYFFADVFSFTTRNADELAVDMGMSVLWASCDLGANTPLELGWLFNFASLEPYLDYVNLTYDSDYVLPDGVPDDISGTEFDAATYFLGGKWRMPTFEEFEELCNNCEVSLSSSYGTVEDYDASKTVFWSKKISGKKIEFKDYSVRESGTVTYLYSIWRWLSTQKLYEESDRKFPTIMSRGTWSWDNEYYYNGIRPVRDID